VRERVREREREREGERERERERERESERENIARAVRTHAEQLEATVECIHVYSLGRFSV